MDNTLTERFSFETKSFFNLLIKDKTYIPISFLTLFEISRLNIIDMQTR